MLFLAFWMTFTLFVQVQDTIPSVVPDSLPHVSAPDTIPPVLPAIPAEAVQDTIPPDTAADTTLTRDAAAGLAPEALQEEVADTIEIWTWQPPEGFEIGETDSTLRWKNMLNLFNRFHQKRGAITTRTGTLGRIDGLELHTFESRHLNLEMEGLDITQPLTGSVDWNRLPVHKIDTFYESEYGGTYRSEVRMRDHYLTKPRTYLNFDESQFNYRSLEFSVTRNFNQKTNAELSYWDRRDGGGYNRSDVEGRQIVAKAYHQLTGQWLLKTAFINNSLDRDEPFGYLMENPLFFTFNHFVESPEELSASSNQTSSDVFLQAHYRPDKFGDVTSELGAHFQTDKWSMNYSADTLATNFRKTELFGRQHISVGGTRLRGTGRLFYFNEMEKQNLTENQWLGARFDLDLTQNLASWSRIHGYASASIWNDDRHFTELSGRLEVNPFAGSEIAVYGGLLSKAPDIQSVYWQSNEITGNTTLLNEEAMTAGAMMEIGAGYFRFGVRGDYRDTRNGIFVDPVEGFLNLAPYTHVSGTGWIGLDSKRFEGEVSAVYKSFSPSGTTAVDQLLQTSGDRTWMKGHLYWKNYLFDRATFVTAGVSGMISPNQFRTAEFLPELNRWQHGTNEFVNPGYYRMDVDVSARIRWFMVLIKWENVLDRMEQAGYFESTGYPMPGRRFIFGLRVLFTN